MLEGAFGRDDLLVGIVVGDLVDIERTGDPFERLRVEIKMRIRFVAGEVAPGRRERVQHEHFGDGFAFGEQHADPREIVIHTPVILPPGLVIEKRGGVVAFAQPAQRVANENLPL